MTTGISLVRENTESMQPPRSLWVTFPLGRPLGKPADPDFQHGVIAAALDLLNEESGPVLADYPFDAPGVDTESSPACPVSFARPASELTWSSRLVGELETLKLWYDLGRRRRNGRTLVGISGLSVAENLEKLGALLDEGQLPVSDLTWFKRAIEDVKAFYLEALTAQPGDYDQQQIQNLMWQQTVLGAALIQFYKMFQEVEQLRPFSRIVAPREVIGGST
ncbi:MAG: hypothetical protein ABGY96_16060 [bacterium]|nr:hypothetical protein [Gammaproteobacteria bacterium]